MNYEKGVTLLELMIAIALMAILVSMINPIMKSVGDAHKKEEIIKEIDESIGNSITIIKREVRNSNGITINNMITSDRGKELVVSQPSNNSIIFTISGSSIIVNNNSSHILAENLTDGWFRHEDKVTVIYLKVEVKGTEREIRDAAVSQIDFK